MTTNRPAMTALQFKAFTAVVSLGMLTEDGRVPQYDAEVKGGARIDSLDGLVRKGWLKCEYSDESFLMPEGLYAGEMVGMYFYSVVVD